MTEYVLGYHLEGVGKRLALMSQLLDSMPCATAYLCCDLLRIG
jgi:hypothetical protein